jgi:MoxR-like ATPase
MTSRDLLGRRSTNEITGDTYWEPSPLVKAAKNGDLLILDGIEKFDTTLNAIVRLCEDRQLQFLDGTNIEISPNFRIIALASTLTVSGFSLVQN